VPCYHPRRVLKRNGELRWDQDPRRLIREGESVFNVPCRECVGCRRADQRQWSVRCFHEAFEHTTNWREPVTHITTELANSSVITLTYNKEHLPPDGALRHSDFQRFMKRLRNYRKRHTHYTDSVRYFMCGEYGGKSGRPHFHAIIFGHDFVDGYIEQSADGQINHMSYELDELWQQRLLGDEVPTKIGRATVEQFTFAGACYVAGYIAKKTSSEAPTGPIEELVDITTGVVRYAPVCPEYRRMSTRPGLAHDWLVKNNCRNLVRIYSTDSVKISNWTFHCPRYYDTLLALHRPDLVEGVKEKRAEGSAEYHAEWTQDRCDAAEKVCLAELQQRRDGL